MLTKPRLELLGKLSMCQLKAILSEKTETFYKKKKNEKSLGKPNLENYPILLLYGQLETSLEE